MTQELQPQRIAISQSLQDFALHNGWHSRAADTKVDERSDGLEGGVGPMPGWMQHYFFLNKFEAPVKEVEHSNDISCLQCCPEVGNDVELRYPVSQIVRVRHGEKVSRSDFGMEVARLTMQQSIKMHRWWTMLHLPLVCPVSGFPINLLHYPPFKLRETAADPNPHSLVDGKSLALFLLSTGSLTVNGRSLEPFEVAALGEHNRRCKVGQYRFNEALSLLCKTHDEGILDTDRAEAVHVFSKIQVIASSDLASLQYMQEQRLLQLHEQMTSSADKVRNKMSYKQESEWSTNSTCASESDSPQFNRRAM